MTFKLDDLGIITDQCLADLRLAKSSKWAVLQKRDTIPGGCSNCGGMGYHLLGFTPGQRGEGRTRAIWYDGITQVNVEARQYPCPVCCAGDALARYEHLWALSGLETTEYRWSLDYLKGRGKDEALEAAWAILTQSPTPRGWATFWGDFGRGKSGILKSLTAAFIRAGVQAHYCRAGEMLLELQNSFGAGPGTQEKILSRYSGYQFLAIDEIDRVGESQWSNSTLMLILDDRYNSRLKTFTAIATNQHPDKMPARFAYLSSRMLDGARVMVGGENLRGAA